MNVTNSLSICISFDFNSIDLRGKINRWILYDNDIISDPNNFVVSFSSFPFSYEIYPSYLALSLKISNIDSILALNFRLEKEESIRFAYKVWLTNCLIVTE
jgi:hypothetical protein